MNHSHNQSTEYRVQSTEYRVQSTEYRVQSFLLNLQRQCVRMALMPVILLILLVPLQRTNAIPHCTGHICPHTPWQSTGSTFVQWGACSFTAHWSYRELTCTGHFCEFRLDRLFKNSGPDTCLNATNAFQITQLAMSLILFENGYNTACGKAIEPDSCRSHFGFTWGGCWKFEGDDPHHGGENDTLIPCKYTACCYSTWLLCKDSKGAGLPPVKISNHGINPDCKDIDTVCFAICEEPTPLSTSNIQENVNNESGFITFVFPNPSSDIINIRLISQSEGKHQIEIFDITGNLILTKNITKQQNEELIQLEMGNYTNGTYNYVIKHNGVPCINGSFNLLK